MNYIKVPNFNFIMVPGPLPETTHLPFSITAGTIKDADGKSVTVKTSDRKVLVSGDSTYTITVESHSETADMSNAEKIWHKQKIRLLSHLKTNRFFVNSIID